MKLSENIVGKGEITQNEQFHLFSTMFSMESVSKSPLLDTFQFSSAASLNLGWPQNSVVGNGLNPGVGQWAKSSLVLIVRLSDCPERPHKFLRTV